MIAAILLHVCVTVLSASGKAQQGADVLRASDHVKPLGTTGNGGIVCIDVPRGTVLLARKDGRTSAEAPALDATLQLDLLNVIATVEARRSLDTSATIGELDPEALVTGGTEQALRLTPRYRSQNEGGSGESEINGIPLPPAPDGGIVGGFTSDLFPSVTPSAAEESDIPNFHLVSPTANLEETLEGGATSYDGTLYRGTASGRQGRFGYGLSLVGGGDSGVLYGQVFRDLSGERYDHSTDAHHIGATANFSYNLKTTSFSFTTVGESRDSADISTVKPGDFFEGYGPNTSQPSDDVASWITIDHDAGRDELSYVGVHYIGGGGLDHGQATFLGEPAMFSLDYNFSGFYQHVKVARKYPNGSLTFGATAQTFTGGSSGGVSPTVQSRSSQSDADVDYERIGTHVSYGTDLGYSHADGQLSASAPSANVHLSYQNHSSMLRLAYDDKLAETLQSFTAATTQLEPATTAQFVCANPNAIVNAPANVGDERPRSQTYSLDLRSATSYGDVSGGAYVQKLSNALIGNVDVGLASIPAGYFSELQRIFAATCPGATLQPDEVFGQALVQVPQVLTREAYLADRKRFGPWTVEGFYEVLSRFTRQGIGGISTIIPGAQLPNVPINRANLLLSYSTNSILLAADGYYVSANNGANLPGHVELMLGGATPLSNGILALSFQNPFGGYRGDFMSSRYAIPLATKNGPLGTLANPVPQTWRLSYTYKAIGSKAGRQNSSSSQVGSPTDAVVPADSASPAPAAPTASPSSRSDAGS